MATVKRIVCLANSRKPNGRCVAGVELSGGRPVAWIRPVSRTTRLLQTYRRYYRTWGRNYRMSELTHPVFTVGHSTHTLEVFVALLSRHGVTALVDVRSTPYSRANPQFNRETLERRLKVHGIKYVFLGSELGARSNDLTCYENGRVQYARLARTELFRSGIDRVIRGANEYHVALMCAEKEPLECHRTLLVARALAELGIVVRHILADGRLEPHDATMERLLDVVGLPHQDLFRSKTEVIAEALVRQEERVAYIDEKLAVHPRKETQ